VNLIELERALRQLRLGGIAAVLETRLRQAQAEAMAPVDLISCLITDELSRRSQRLLDRRRKQAAFRDPHKTLDNFDMRKLPLTAAEDLLEIIMRRYERVSTLLTSNRPVEDWGKLLGDVAAVTAMLDRLLHHGHVLKCGPRSWRTKTAVTVAAGSP
jgi:DNA replication protein DnaC